MKTDSANLLHCASNRKKDSLEKRKQCEHGTSATKEPRAKLTIYR